MARRAGLPVLLPVDLLVGFVVLHETSVRIHLETRLLPVGFDNNLVIPLPIRVVFPDYPNDVSACCLLINCLLDRCGEGFQVNLFSGMFSGLSGRHYARQLSGPGNEFSMTRSHGRRGCRRDEYRPRHCALFISLCHCRVESKKARIGLVKHWEIIAADRSPRNPAEDFLHYSIGTVGCLGI